MPTSGALGICICPIKDSLAKHQIGYPDTRLKEAEEAGIHGPLPLHNLSPRPRCRSLGPLPVMDGLSANCSNTRQPVLQIGLGKTRRAPKVKTTISLASLFPPTFLIAKLRRIKYSLVSRFILARTIPSFGVISNPSLFPLFPLFLPLIRTLSMWFFFVKEKSI